MVGTPGDDTLRGTPRRDVIAGLGGDDAIRGLGGDDVVCGGLGQDRVYGGPGQDWVDGDEGGDRISGGAGDDVVRTGAPGTPQYDEVKASDPGNDLIVVSSHEAFVIYGAATSAVVVDVAAGTADGPSIGHDRLRFARLDQGAFIRGSTHGDTLLGGPGPDSLDGQGGEVTIDGRGGDDYLWTHRTKPLSAGSLSGGTGNDFIGVLGSAQAYGGEGDDLIEMITRVTADAVVSGGPGHDRADLTLVRPDDGSAPFPQVTADLSAGLVSAGGASFDLTGVEDLDVTDGAVFDWSRYPVTADTYLLRGTDGANLLTLHTTSFSPVPGELHGLVGDDVLTGSTGDDLLDGGPGSDTGDGGGGNDTCTSVEAPSSCETLQP
jgi:Ca2+-binding RTX toxin-like protein